MEVDLTPHEKKTPQKTGPENQEEDLLEITQAYLENLRLTVRNKASDANKPAFAALGLSVLALFLAGGIFTAVFIYATVLLVTLIPQIKESQGKKEIAAKAGRTTLIFLPLFGVSLVGIYAAPLVGAAAIVTGASQFRSRNATGKKRSVSMWAIAFGTVAIMLSMTVVGVSVMGKAAGPPSPAMYSPAPAENAAPPSPPILNPPDYVDKEGLAAYKELKEKGYDVTVVFGDRSLTDKYGEATDFFESLALGKSTEEPSKNLVVGGVSQSGKEIKLTVVTAPDQTPSSVTPTADDDETAFSDE